MARVGGAAGGTLQIVVYVLTIFTTVCHLSPTLGHKKCSKKCHKANYRLPPPPSASFLSIPARWRTFYELSVAGQPGQIKYSPLGDFVRAKRLVMGAYFLTKPVYLETKFYKMVKIHHLFKWIGRIFIVLPYKIPFVLFWILPEIRNALCSPLEDYLSTHDDGGWSQHGSLATIKIRQCKAGPGGGCVQRGQFWEQGT